VFFKIFWAFLKVGTFGFGGPGGSLALIEREMADMGVMGSTEFADAIATISALPGPYVTKTALYCGYTAGGYSGAAAALIGVLLPSSIGILLLLRFLSEFRETPRVEAVLRALRPVVVALFLYLASTSAKGLRPSWDLLLIGALALGLLIFRVEPMWVVLGALVVGLLFY
jgi:chromate transporter